MAVLILSIFRGIITGIHPNSSSETVQQILESSRAQIVVVDELEQLEKVLEIKDRVPNLKAIIQTKPPYQDALKLKIYYKWFELQNMNTEDLEESYEEKLDDLVINETCCVMYSPDNSGSSKGMILCHDNLTWTAYTIGQSFDAISIGKEITVSFMPLSDVFVQLTDIFVSLTYAFNVFFADKDALEGTLFRTIAEVKPTHLFAVPKVFERLQEKLMEFERNADPLQALVTSWAKKAANRYHCNKMEGQDNSSFQYNIAKKFIFPRIKSSLGLEHCHTLISCGTQTSIDTRQFFMNLDMPISTAYGMGETTGAHSIALTSSQNHFNFDTAGRNLEGTKTRILNPDDRGHGEVSLKFCFELPSK